MKSTGGVAVLHPHDSLNYHPDNLLSTPNKSHRAIKLNHSYTNSPSQNPNFTDSRRRTPPKGIPKKNNRYTEIAASKHTDSNNRREFFAGSAFVDSPPPSSVPIPGFFTKSFVASVTDDHDPTTELRRILGLNLS